MFTVIEKETGMPVTVYGMNGQYFTIYNEQSDDWEYAHMDAYRPAELWELTEALKVVDHQTQRIVELTEAVMVEKSAAVQQRMRAQTAEDFVCKLCTECEWEDQDGITTMVKKCCSWFPECGKFKQAAAEDLRLAMDQLKLHCCDYCKHEELSADEHPCDECINAGGLYSKWEWRKPEVDHEN